MPIPRRPREEGAHHHQKVSDGTAGAEETAGHVSFFASLEKRRRVMTSDVTLSSAYEAFCGLFLMDNLEHKNISVWVVTFHYIPLLAIVLGFTVDCLLHVFLSLIFPFIDFTEALDTPQMLRLVVVVLCHSGVYIGVTIAGYVVLCTILDAMVDTCLYIVHPVLHVAVPHYVLLQDLLHIAHHGSWWSIVSLMILIVTSFGGALYVALLGEANVFGPVSIHESVMLKWCTGVLLIAALWITLSFGWFHIGHCRRKSSAYSAALTEWWRSVLPRVRRRATYAILVAAAYRFLQEGGTEGMRSVSEGMMYLVAPHVLFVWCTGVVKVCMQLWSAAHTAYCDSGFKYTCAILLFPWTMLMAASWYLFRLPLYVAAEMIPLIGMIVTLHGFEQGNSQHRDPSHDPLPTAGNRIATALRLYLCNTKDVHRKTPHFRVGRIVRTVLRVLLGAAFFSVAILGCWVALQQRGWMRGPQPTTSRAIPPSAALGETDRIRVSTDFLVADLFGLPPESPIDPMALLYEPDVTPDDTNRYAALCSRWWHRHLHAADLAFFSLMSYLDRKTQDFNDTLSFYQKHRINGTSWDVVPTEKAFRTPTHVPIVHFRSDEHRISVIAVRGTDLAAPIDFLQNIFVFSETAIFQIFGSLVPLGAMFSDQVKAEVYAACSYLASTLFGENVLEPNPKSHYYHLQVESYIARHVPADDEVVLTGHSLGGTIASIVAARNRYVALAFASPGIGLLHKKFGISLDRLDAYTSNIIVSNDVIPLVDRMSGTIYHVQCEHTRGQICHSIELQTIRMWTMCPQYRSLVYVNGTYTITPLPYREMLNTAVDFAAALGSTLVSLW